MTSAASFNPANPARATLAVIAVALVIRLAMAGAIGLGTDEIYTVAVSRTLSWSYFDHPPLHQWIAHATALLLGEGRQVRLPFILLFAGTSWLLFRLTTRLYDDTAGFWAVVTLNLSGFFTLSAGSWVVPDGVLLFMLAVAALALAREFFPKPDDNSSSLANWLLAGLALGLAGLSKYQAALAALGIGIYVLATPMGRRALMRPAPWLAALLGLVTIAPVLIWNAHNGWVSFLFQSARTQGAGFAPWLVPASLLAQAGWLLPWVFVPMVSGLWLAWKTRRDARFWFLIALALPAIAIFTLTPAFGNLGLPHWAMPGWFFVMPLAGLYLADLANSGPKPQRWARMAATGSVLVLALLASQAATGWLGRISPAVSRNDPTLETFGWDQLSARLDEAGLGLPKAGLGLPKAGLGLPKAGLGLPRDRFIISDGWLTAGRIDVALKGSRTVLPGTVDPRHFAFMIDQQALLGRDAILIVRARREAQLRTAMATHFNSLGTSIPISLGRDGLSEIALIAIPATHFAKPLPWPYGRQP